MNDVGFCSTKLALRSRLDGPPQCLAGELHAVADSENGNAKLKESGVDLRSPFFVNAGRPA